MRTETCLVETAKPVDRPRALWIVLQNQPEESRNQLIRSALDALQSNRAALDGLLLAKRGQLIVGATWGQRMAGNTAIIWSPGLLDDEPPQTAEMLLEHLTAHLRSHDVKLLQAVLRLEDEADDLLLRKCGFFHAADLTYLACPRDRLVPRRTSGSLDFEPFHMRELERLQQVIQLTYHNTLDCPALNGLRPISEVVEGYLNTGTFSADRWFFVRHENQDVGCLLLTDHPHADQWELIYMGLVETARGKGWGSEIVDHARRRTAMAGRNCLVLAVDSRNSPAMNAYNQAGFQPICQRRVLLQSL